MIPNCTVGLNGEPALACMVKSQLIILIDSNKKDEEHMGDFIPLVQILLIFL